jgi:hypothetical protein
MANGVVFKVDGLNGGIGQQVGKRRKALKSMHHHCCDSFKLVLVGQ